MTTVSKPNKKPAKADTRDQKKILEEGPGAEGNEVGGVMKQLESNLFTSSARIPGEFPCPMTHRKGILSAFPDRTSPLTLTLRCFHDKIMRDKAMTQRPGSWTILSTVLLS